jgi:hypothetical protein
MTVGRLVAKSRASWLLDMPSAAPNTMEARNASFCGVLGSRGKKSAPAE